MRREPLLDRGTLGFAIDPRGQSVLVRTARESTRSGPIGGGTPLPQRAREVGANQTGRNRIDADVMRAVLDRQISYQLQVSRLQPNSRGEIQVRLEGAAFDDLLAWLHDMEQGEGLLVREVSITQAGTVGRVNATVRVAQAG